MPSIGACPLIFFGFKPCRHVVIARRPPQAPIFLHVIAKERSDRSNLNFRRRLLRPHFVCPRNDIHGLNPKGHFLENLPPLNMLYHLACLAGLLSVRSDSPMLNIGACRGRVKAILYFLLKKHPNNHPCLNIICPSVKPKGCA